MTKLLAGQYITKPFLLDLRLGAVFGVSDLDFCTLESDVDVWAVGIWEDHDSGDPIQEGWFGLDFGLSWWGCFRRHLSVINVLDTW